MNEELKALREQKEKSKQIKAIIQKMAPAVANAGETGENLEWLDTMFTQVFQPEKAAARQIMESSAGQLFTAFKPPGIGNVTEKETGMFLAAGPNVSHRPEVNRFLVDYYTAQSDATDAYVDFKTAWAERTGETRGADEAWLNLLGGEHSLAISDETGQLPAVVNPLIKRVLNKETGRTERIMATADGGGVNLDDAIDELLGRTR